jgi:4a-hydroxytetrahydrobiopterin dehydratase
MSEWDRVEREQDGMETLAELHCKPLQTGEERVAGTTLPHLHRHVPQWRIADGHGAIRLHRMFDFSTFSEALTFTDQVGRIAQDEGHFPVLLTEWGHVQVWWWTPELHGLLLNDFIMAAKTDRAYEAARQEDVLMGHETWSLEPTETLGPD